MSEDKQTDKFKKKKKRILRKSNAAMTCLYGDSRSFIHFTRRQPISLVKQKAQLFAHKFLQI